MSGRQLRVNAAQQRDRNAPFTERPQRERTPAGGAGGSFGGRPQHSVFVGNLAWTVDDTLIREMVTDVVGAGTFTNIRISMDPSTGRSRGFGHIDFVDAETANRAVEMLHNLEVEGRQLRADHAQSKTSGDRPSFGGDRPSYGGGDRAASGGFRGGDRGERRSEGGGGAGGFRGGPRGGARGGGDRYGGGGGGDKSGGEGW